LNNGVNNIKFRRMFLNSDWPAQVSIYDYFLTPDDSLNIIISLAAYPHKFNTDNNNFHTDSHLFYRINTKSSADN